MLHDAAFRRGLRRRYLHRRICCVAFEALSPQQGEMPCATSLEAALQSASGILNARFTNPNRR